MKRSIIILLGIFVLASLAVAQPHRGKFNPEEFKAKLENFITEEAGFTAAEAQAFYPIYHEMKGKQRELQRAMHQLKKDIHQGEASDKDYAAAIQKIKDIGVETAQIEVNYYKKLCAAVSPRKVYAAMLAEDRFHRQMLEGFGGGKEHRKKP